MNDSTLVGPAPQRRDARVLLSKDHPESIWVRVEKSDLDQDLKEEIYWVLRRLQGYRRAFGSR